MKHQHLIDKFRKGRDENDGYCDIIWLPSSQFDGILPGAMTDILGAFLDIEDGFRLSFLISDPETADRDQDMVSFGSFPFSVQKLIYNYLFQ